MPGLRTLILAGVHAGLSEAMQKRVLLMNALATGLLALSMVMWPLFRLPLLHTCLTLAFLAAGLAPVWLLNRAGLLHLSRLYFTFALSVHPLVVTVLFTGLPGATVVRGFLCINAFIPMVMFRLKEWRWMALGVGFLVAANFVLEPVTLALDHLQVGRLPGEQVAALNRVVGGFQILIIAGLYLLSQRLDLDAIRRALARSQASEASYRQLSEELEQRVKARTAEYLVANEALQLALLERNDFYHLVVHDLKNPLNTISLMGEHLASLRRPPEDLRERAQKIVETADRMKRLLVSLLAVEALEGGEGSPRIDMFDLAQVVRDVVEANLHASERKGQRILVEADRPCPLAGDRLRVTEAVENLLGNAIKYSPEGATIRIATRPWERGTACIVEDQGPGFTDEDRKRLFHRHARLSARPTGGEHSSGLGLFIVKKVVDMHGGTIRLEPRGGGPGSRFIMHLPTVPIPAMELEASAG